jgi:diacylglycerol kinase (ATP)
MNEVASGLVGTKAVLGLVSCGSGNGLGRHLGTHGSLARSLSLLHTGRVAEIDTGFAAGFPFFNLAGLGFEALLAERFNRLKKRGLPRYALATLRSWNRRHPIDFRIAWEGSDRSVSSVSLTVANGSQYGNNFRIAPSAQIDDGLLDLVAIPELGHVRSVSMLWALLRGSIDSHPDVTRIRASRFEVTASEEGLLHVDGETHQAPQPVSFTIRPASLKILVPAN